MSAKGICISEECFTVQLINVHDWNGGGDHHSLVVGMKNWEHLTMIISIGVASRAAGVITVESCSALGASPGTATKIAFSYYECLLDFAATTDILSARKDVTVAATGIVPPVATSNIRYQIELNSGQLLTNHVGFRLDVVDAGAACLASAIGICSGGRYVQAIKATVTS